MNRNLLRSEIRADSIAVYRLGETQPLLVQRAEPEKRPYIHPIAAPDGHGVLTENAPPHHPWQHGLYFGLNDVNGVGFWEEGPCDGYFQPGIAKLPEISGNRAAWDVTAGWFRPDGECLLSDTQQWTFKDFVTEYELDVNWTLHAEVDVAFGQYRYGGLFLRMPFREEAIGPFAVNSEGDRNQGADQKKARWVALSMPIQGKADPACIVIMDHPGNPEFPVPWRVDEHFGVSPSRCIAGSWYLAKGESQVYRYRLYISTGNPDFAGINRRWTSFAEE